MRVVQISTAIHPGTGQAGVAWNLEQEFRKRGIPVESFTLATALRGRRRWAPKRPFAVKLERAWRIIWLSCFWFAIDRPSTDRSVLARYWRGRSSTTVAPCASTA